MYKIEIKHWDRDEPEWVGLKDPYVAHGLFKQLVVEEIDCAGKDIQSVRLINPDGGVIAQCRF